MEIEKAVSKILKSTEHIYAVYHVGGGCINNTYKIITSKGKYFLKSNDAKQYPMMFELEAKGLETIRNTQAIRTPYVLGSTIINNKSFLLIDFIESGIKDDDFYATLGSNLAAMHKHQRTLFGLEYDNYIGSLKQPNAQTDKWSEFYIHKRIEPMFELAVNKGYLNHNIYENLNHLKQYAIDEFPDEPASLLHGDLWSGNVMSDENGKPYLIDPAVYYGHREMDIAMTLFIGKFNDSFYAEYNNVYKLEKGWQQRVEFCLLYYYLVHVNLFGKPYLPKTMELLKKFAAK